MVTLKNNEDITIRENNKKIFITTPIYYVNAKPHIGHAYTTVVCDVFARFYRMMGYDVKFSTGTDEHGKKIEQSAVKLNKKPEEFVNEISQLFRDLLPVLNISNDNFIRTTEPRHIKTVQQFWNKLKEKGYIYLGEYKGWYDIRNEAYFDESELIDGKSPLGGEVTYMVEPCYFFKLSAFEDKLLKFYEENPDFIFPISRRNEVISFIKQGLQDLSISRTTFSWGIQVPNDPKHVVYVWLDALTNYLTVNGYPDEDQNNNEYWRNSLHFVGKEIVRFHALYWPAFLMAVGINPPKQIISHGWWLSEGEKMSKSLGNVQDPVKYCKLFGSDALRYYLLRELPFGADGNFSLNNFINRYNSVLANSYGNLCNRVISFISKYCNNTINKPSIKTEEDIDFANQIKTCIDESFNNIKSYSFHKYLEKLENAFALANQYLDSQKPWILRNSDIKRMEDVLYITLEQIYNITKALYPVMPISTERVLRSIGIEIKSEINIDRKLPDTINIQTPEVLFPRIDTKDISKFDVYANN